uniref:Uncharacterized protein n=1 Tax=Octopus bimaculoides TaxID=37653 RepID=A0A0L8GMD1_OCTBM
MKCGLGPYGILFPSKQYIFTVPLPVINHRSSCKVLPILLRKICRKISRHHQQMITKDIQIKLDIFLFTFVLFKEALKILEFVEHCFYKRFMPPPSSLNFHASCSLKCIEDLISFAFIEQVDLRFKC